MREKNAHPFRGRYNTRNIIEVHYFVYEQFPLRTHAHASCTRIMHAHARTQVLVSQWFLTLFSYSLRPPTLLRVLDLTFTDGWKAMFRFGLARLRSVEVSGVGFEQQNMFRFGLARLRGVEVKVVFEQQKQRGVPGDGRRPGRRGGGVAFIWV